MWPSLGFEARDSQSDGEVAFLSRSPGHMLFLTPSEAVLVLITKDAPEVFSRPASVALEASGSTVQVKPSVVYMKLLDASPSPRIVGPG
jgi:hypothetical protein